MDRKALPYIGALGLAWGSNLVISRFGIGQFEPLVWITLRLVIAVAAFTAFYTFSPNRQWPRNPQLWLYAAIVGVFATAVPLMGFVFALEVQSAGLTGLLATTAPAITVVVAHFLLAEARLNWPTVIGVVVALSGAVLIITLGETGLPDVTEANPIGALLLFVALLCEALAAAFIRQRMQGMDAFDVTSVRLLAALVVVTPLTLWQHELDFAQVNVAGWGALLFAALVSTFVAQMLAFYVTRTFGTTAFAIVGYIAPMVAIIGGVLFLGETITLGMLAGMVLIVSGIFIVNRRRTI